MNETVRNTLKELVARHGLPLARDSRRCEAWLCDLCPEHRREVESLVYAMKKGMVNEILDFHNSVPAEFLITRLSQKLIDNAPIDKEMARWSIESWAFAIGITAKSPPLFGPSRFAPTGDDELDRMYHAGEWAKIAFNGRFQRRATPRMANGVLKKLQQKIAAGTATGIDRAAIALLNELPQIIAGEGGESQKSAEAPKLLEQEEHLFHRDERLPHTYKLRPAPTEAERAQRTDLGNPKNPLGQMQGNDKARKRLCDAAFAALGRYNHLCTDVAFLLTGPKGAPIAEIARRFAELLRLPFIEINPATVKTIHDLFIEIGNGLQRAQLPLVEWKGPGDYLLPPCVIFIDDCHAFKPTVMEALFDAVASTDPALRTEFKGVHVRTNYATWIMATTERADLVRALENCHCHEVRLPSGEMVFLGPDGNDYLDNHFTEITLTR